MQMQVQIQMPNFEIFTKRSIATYYMFERCSIQNFIHIKGGCRVSFKY